MDSLMVGSLGALLILIAFVLGQFHIWKDTDRAYDLFNLIGSALLLWYAWVGEVWPFVVLNAVWVVVSLRDVVLGARG